EHHVQNGQRKAGHVEAALAAEVGSPVTVRLEVAAGGSSPRPAAGAPSSPSPAEPAAEVTDDPDEHLAGTDVHDLDDAPDAPASGIDALTEAFPGAEFVDPS
ncbi:MAG: hypothetical protein KDA98_02440, partial [Acidimicrobiales bacterium]|nr:hypothetical protein [Acidimicrobiales bacterium]